jgi:hypothetical protein
MSNQHFTQFLLTGFAGTALSLGGIRAVISNQHCSSLPLVRLAGFVMLHPRLP